MSMLSKCKIIGPRQNKRNTCINYKIFYKKKQAKLNFKTKDEEKSSN